MYSFGIARLALGVVFGVSVALMNAHAGGGGGIGEKGTIGIVCQADDGKLYRYNSFDSKEEQLRFKACIGSAVREWAPLLSHEYRLKRRARDLETSGGQEVSQEVTDGLESYQILLDALRREVGRPIRRSGRRTN